MVRMAATIISVEHAAMQKRFSDLNFLQGSDISWRSTEPILLPMCIKRSASKDITILQYFALLDQIKVHFDKEELLRINDQLNKIKQPRH